LKLYGELAEWWPLISDPADYAGEAAFFHETFAEAGGPARTMLELGSGGGNNAFHLKAHYAMCLVDVSPQMLAVSRSLNPECEHVEGDMRTVRLGRAFERVFVHDAIEYMTTEDDLRAAIRTASLHCRPGGVALFVPDFVRETFAATTDHGGHDDAGRGARYLEWTFDPDPDDTTYRVEFAVMVRDEAGDIRLVHDPHVFGLFRRDDWLRLLREAGFDPRTLRDPWGRDVFVAKRSE
jgi:SAM-dependent methyltransferase